MKQLLFGILVIAVMGRGWSVDTNTLNVINRTDPTIMKNVKFGDTLYLQESADNLMRPFRTTTNAREDSWYITYTHQMNFENISNTLDVVTNSYGGILSKMTIYKSYDSRSTLDAASPTFVNYPITYTCDNPNATITADNQIIVTQPGMYVVKAVDNEGRIATTEVPFQKKVVESYSYTEYTADACNTTQSSNRNAMINEFVGFLNNSNIVDYVWARSGESGLRTNTEIHVIQPLHSWTVTDPMKRADRSGSAFPFAVSPHVMATGYHWYWVNHRGGYTTLSNYLDGTTFQVHRQPGQCLRTWALENGWTEASLAELDIGDLGDISLIVLDEGEIPSELCPYFTDRETVAELFGSMENLPCWTSDQTPSRWATPGVIGKCGIKKGNTFGGASMLMGFPYIPTLDIYKQRYRKDIFQLIEENFNVWKFWLITNGDSGRDVFFRWKGQNVIISTYHTAGTGPDYISAFPLIKAFVEAQGDTLKIMQK